MKITTRSKQRVRLKEVAPITYPNQSPSEQTLTIVERLKAGATYTALATEYGITKQRISNIAKRHGVTKTPVDNDTTRTECTQA